MSIESNWERGWYPGRDKDYAISDLKAENATLQSKVERLREAIQEALSELIKDCKYCKVNNCHTQCSDNAADILRKAATP